jgi:hypothetical protein
MGHKYASQQGADNSEMMTDPFGHDSQLIWRGETACAVMRICLVICINNISDLANDVSND